MRCQRRGRARATKPRCRETCTGNQQFCSSTERSATIRLVALRPRRSGKFGGTDNWCSARRAVLCSASALETTNRRLLSPRTSPTVENTSSISRKSLKNCDDLRFQATRRVHPVGRADAYIAERFTTGKIAMHRPPRHRWPAGVGPLHHYAAKRLVANAWKNGGQRR